MGKLGKWEYPDLELNEAIVKAEEIHVDYSDKISAGNLAKIFGISARGGAFPLKVKDMKDYGLLEGERDDYRLTPLALKIIENSQDSQSRAEAFLRIGLFKAMHDHFRGKMPDNMDVFKNRLKDVLRPVDENAVSIRAARLRNRYNEAIPFLTGERKLTGSVDRARMKSPAQSSAAGSVPGVSIDSSPNQMYVPDADFYLVDKRNGYFVITIDNLRKLNLAKDYLEGEVESMGGKSNPRKPESKQASDRKSVQKKQPSAETVTA